MSSRRQRSIPLGGRYRQVSLYQWSYPKSIWASRPHESNLKYSTSKQSTTKPCAYLKGCRERAYVSVDNFMSLIIWYILAVLSFRISSSYNRWLVYLFHVFAHVQDRFKTEWRHNHKICSTFLYKRWRAVIYVQTIFSLSVFRPN